MITADYKRDYRALEEFFDSIEGDIGPTLKNSVHDYTSVAAINRINEIYPLKDKSVLDVGCGLGRDLEKFKELGAKAYGLTLNKEEWLKNHFSDPPVYLGDQNFMHWSIKDFDLVYASHVLEHSPIPFFTLIEYNRILKKGGFCYVEVPSPQPWSIHNQNHYSIFCKDMWLELFDKAGFTCIEQTNLKINIETDTGKIEDEFWGFILKKKNA